MITDAAVTPRLTDAPHEPDVPTPPDVPRPPATMDAVPPVLQLVTFALLACVLTLVNRFAGLFVPLDKLPVWGQHVLASAYFAALLYALMRLTRAAALLAVSAPTLLGDGGGTDRHDGNAALLAVSAPALLAVGLALAAPMGTVLLLGEQKIESPAWLVLTANNLFLPVGVALLGTVVGRIIKHPNTLLAAAGFAIFFDIVIVSMGTVAALTQSGSQLISMVSVGAGTALPQQAAHKTWALITGVTIGPADVLFLSVFFASVFLLRLEGAKTFRWVFGLLLLALLEVEWIGFPVPALAPMGAAVLIANARYAAFTKQERRDLVIGAVFAVACAAFIVVKAQQFAATERARMIAEQKKQIGFEIAPYNGVFVIAAVMPGSRAASAGLRAGDVVQKINGVPTKEAIRNARQYAQTLQNAARVGITLTIKSGDRPQARDVVFALVGSVN